MKDTLQSELRERECACRVVDIRRLRDLEADIESRREQEMFDATFYQERLARFDFTPPADMPEARSIVVVARPSPQTGVVFHWRGESPTLILPPTYAGFHALCPAVESWVNDALQPLGYRAMNTLGLPIKPLAVHSGLAKYGKNNITYVDGMGSFQHLFAFYSDLPCERDEWHEMAMLERCQNCRACVVTCPTGAIGTDRFLLHAERCLAFFNERPGGVPFPAWIDPSWHNSIFGCMTCQWYCPEDRPFRHWIDTKAEFSEEETALLLNDASRGALPAGIMAKLERLELVESLDALPRNLGVLLNGTHPMRWGRPRADRARRSVAGSPSTGADSRKTDR